MKSEGCNNAVRDSGGIFLPKQRQEAWPDVAISRATTDRIKTSCRQTRQPQRALRRGIGTGTAAARQLMSISHWSCAQVAAALRALGTDPLPARVLTAALAFVERHKLDGADALDASGDDRVLAQWLPPDAYATDQRVRLLFGFDGSFLPQMSVGAVTLAWLNLCVLSHFSELAYADCSRCIPSSLSHISSRN
jgi:hypothetical protein